MKKFHVDINFNEVTRRIEQEMEGYSPSAWAEKIGVRINVVSNIHGASAKQNPSLNYIVAVSLATRKPVEYFLWGKPFDYQFHPGEVVVGESHGKYSEYESEGIQLIPPPPNPEMGKRIRYWREDMGLSIAQVAKRTDLPVEVIKKLESGFHTTTDVIVKIADILRCSIDYLLGCGSASIPQLLRFEKSKAKVEELEDDKAN
jgi:hypothetical protein